MEEEAFPFTVQCASVIEDKKRKFNLFTPANAAPVQIKKPLIPRDPLLTMNDLIQRIQVTPEQIETIEKLKQGSVEWLESRKFRLTGSNFGSAVGSNFFTTPTQLVKEMLWNTFKGNVATQWGSDHEDDAREQYLTLKRAEMAAGHVNIPIDQTDPIVAIDIETTGLLINQDRPYLGNSPDGIIILTFQSGKVEKGLLEIKCPYKYRTGNKFYPEVPPHYMDQMQGLMGNLDRDLKWAEFVCWNPQHMDIRHIPFDSEYWNGTLLPALNSFYHDLYLPALLKKENNMLYEGEIE